MPQSDAKDPFAFEEDVFGEATIPPSRNLTPPSAPRSSAPPPAPPSKKPAPQDDLGFGDDVADLLAPLPPRQPGKAVVAKGPDPFGPSLSDDPFDVAGEVTRGTDSDVHPSKTDEIPSFDVELGSGAMIPVTPRGEPVEQNEKTLEMDRPPAPPPPRRESSKVKILPPPAPPKKTLFAQQTASPDGSLRFSKPSAAVG
jgi:hypothetical protein